jgi:hypothetical protein
MTKRKKYLDFDKSVLGWVIIFMLAAIITLILFTLHPIELKIEDCPAPKECYCAKPSCTCNCNFNLIQNQTCPEENNYWNPEPIYPIYINYSNITWPKITWLNLSWPSSCFLLYQRYK